MKHVSDFVKHFSSVSFITLGEITTPMNTCLKHAMFSCMLLFSISLRAQPAVQQLEKYLKQIGEDRSTPVPSAVLSDVRSEKALLKVLYGHLNDPGEDFQFRVLDLVRMIGLKSKDPNVRNLAVNCLVRGIPNFNMRVRGQAISAIVQFSKQDFSAEDKDSIVSYLRTDMPNLPELFRLAGYLEIPGAKPKISAIISSSINQIQKWNARLALARLGDDEAINFILEKITSSNVDDSFVFSIVPGLVYTRNKRVFGELEKILQSDVYRCSSSHPDSKSTVLCAYRLLESMAGTIDGFPIKVDEGGDMIVDNYQVALETARRWFKQNPDYTLSRNTM